MKLHLVTAVVAAALFASAPSRAAVLVVGQGEPADCFQAAAAQTGGKSSSYRVGSALAHCNTALAGDLSYDDRTATLANRGILQAAAGDIDAAVADYNAALSRNPDMADVYIDRGTAMLHDARYEEARADFDHALKLGMENPHIGYFDRGEAEEASGNLLAAYRDYSRARDLAPEFKPATLELGRFHVIDRQVADGR